MERRQFLQSIAIVGAAVAAANVSKLFTLFSSPTVRHVTIYFPPNKSYATYHSEIPIWMNRQKWRAYLEDVKSSGALQRVDQTILSDRVIYTYKFRSHQDLVEFNKVAGASCNANLKTRESLGYSCDVNFA